MTDVYSLMMKKRSDPSSSSSDGVQSSSKVDSRAHQPWVEKYRPKSMDDVVYQEEVVSVLRKSLLGSDFPNLLFYGPPGTGKTSTILALAKQMFGDQFRNRVLELNASDERGIGVIREKVKTFAQQTAYGNRCSTSFKLIVLDEADSMTPAAQSALRRIIEKETKSTRFCLICNYVSRIIEPIASRCAKFRFKPLKQEAIEGRLQQIAQLEQVRFESDRVLNELIAVSEGDLRRAITMMQTAFRMKDAEDAIEMVDVHEVSGHIPSDWIFSLADACISKSYEKVRRVISDLLAEGYSAGQLFLQLHDWLLSARCTLTDNQKAVICTELAKSDHSLLDGADEYLQALNVAFQIVNQI